MPDIVVMGASAGGVAALQEVVSVFPADLDAAVFVVLHLLADAESLLPQILSRASKLRAENGVDGARVEPGRIYVAPPDRHMLFQNGRLAVVRGPKQNLHRPSIDVLFRSAALRFGPRVAAVLLTGADDDGASGMRAVHERGGATIVQDPEEAEHPRMPASALRVIQPDFKLRVAEIGPRLVRLVAETGRKVGVKAMPEPEDRFSDEQQKGVPLDDDAMGEPSAFTCPDCNGTLWELQNGDLVRYRCRIGHAYTASAMLEANSESVERALWAAVRSLEESASLSRRIAGKTGVLREDLQRKADERETHARVIRDLLLTSQT